MPRHVAGLSSAAHFPKSFGPPRDVPLGFASSRPSRSGGARRRLDAHLFRLAAQSLRTQRGCPEPLSPFSFLCLPYCRRRPEAQSAIGRSYLGQGGECEAEGERGGEWTGFACPRGKTASGPGWTAPWRATVAAVEQGAGRADALTGLTALTKELAQPYKVGNKRASTLGRGSAGAGRADRRDAGEKHVPCQRDRTQSFS